jgi:hypothetical protein
MKKQISSSKKIAREARKIYLKEMQKDAQKMASVIGNAMKPKPRFVPWWAWMILVRMVIRVKK